MDDWFKNIFAQDYGDGSKGIDFLSTQDGSESEDNATFNQPNPFDLSMGEGMGQRPDNGHQEHPISSDGEIAHDSDNSYQGRNEHNTDDSSRYTTMPFSEEGVDDNHNNNLGMTASPTWIDPAQLKDWSENAPVSQKNPLIDMWENEINQRNEPKVSKKPSINFFRKPKFARQGEEADFFTSHVTGGPADSPQLLDDGQADEELQRDQEGVKSTTNNFDTSTKTNNSIFQDPGVVRKDNDNWDIAEINKGRTAQKLAEIWHQAHNSKFDSIKSEVFNERFSSMLFEQSINQMADYHWGDDSNVQQYYDPDEVRNDKIKKGKDYGTGDISSNDNQSNAPLDDGTNPDMKNYSGVDHSASLLNIIMRTADYGGVMPSANPNSGRDQDDMYDDESLIHRPSMSDGKQISTTDNMADKEFNDSSYYRNNRIKYDNKNRAGDDTDSYYNVSGSGSGGMGMEGDGQNFSGVNNA